MKGKFGWSLPLVLGLALGGGLGTACAAGGMEGTAKADRLDACVAPTDFMRRRHFELIKHQREVTVHQGIRQTDNSLSGCVDCHVRQDARGQHVPVNAPGEFCAGCHEYTATMLDCFSCHATQPTENLE